MNDHGKLLAVIRAADHLADLPPLEIKLILLLARHVDPSTGIVEKTQKEIADEAGCGLKTVNSNIRALRERGTVEIVHRTGRANVYRLMTSAIIAAILGYGAGASTHDTPTKVRECLLC